ncbi:UNVERIFIED_CONTAM: YrhK family protein [Kocuria sp. CPCC 205295]|uniref:YrhK family protein n=1 Tax=Kocuria TaxID=57493 RepID=UPI0010F935EE|nr:MULTISPECIES: YrhK family protein [Kocuria]MCM3330681.1 YrhK family protein [Kocuria palustris]
MTKQDRDLDIRMGHHELVIRQRYEVLSIANDFVLGSIQMMLRPTIRFVRRTHLQRLRPAQPHETSTDF